MFAQNSPPPAQTPFYATSSIVNAANYLAEPLAPNTLVTLYGTNLAYVERAIADSDLEGAILPTALSGTGVKVLVAKMPVPLLYVSPKQVNFLIPTGFPASGEVDVQLGLDSRFGPAVKIKLGPASPALFAMDPEFAIATRPDGSVITRDAPARGGEVIILYATGLGATDPRVPMGQIATQAAPIVRMSEFRVWLGAAELPRESVLYAGVTPGFAGLFQINVRLPGVIGRNPEVQVGFPDVRSPAGMRLWAE